MFLSHLLHLQDAAKAERKKETSLFSFGISFNFFIEL